MLGEGGETPGGTDAVPRTCIEMVISRPILPPSPFCRVVPNRPKVLPASWHGGVILGRRPENPAPLNANTGGGGRPVAEPAGSGLPR